MRLGLAYSLSSSWSTSSWSAPAPTPSSALRCLPSAISSVSWNAKSASLPGSLDRILLACLSRLFPRTGLPSLLPRPETLLRWHRDLVRRRWAAFHHRSLRPRPARDLERRDCVLKLARENPGWGYRRIQGEALKLGFRISHMGVAKILRSQGIAPAPRRSQTCPVNPRHVSLFSGRWRGGGEVDFCDAPRSCSTSSPTRLSASCWRS